MTSSICPESNTRTSACCTSCPWTAGEQLADLTVRVCARHHTMTTGHRVAALTTTLTVYTATTPAAFLVPGEAA